MRLSDRIFRRWASSMGSLGHRATAAQRTDCLELTRDDRLGADGALVLAWMTVYCCQWTPSGRRNKIRWADARDVAAIVRVINRAFRTAESFFVEGDRVCAEILQPMLAKGNFLFAETPPDSRLRVRRAAR